MLIQIDDLDLNTILAALRYYRENDQDDPMMRTDSIHNIATDGDTQISMDATGIDACTSA